MIHSVMWRIPAILISLAVLAPYTWALFDHHFAERNPGHNHAIAYERHTHSFELILDHHEVPENINVSELTVISNVEASAYSLSQINGVCNFVDTDKGHTYSLIKIASDLDSLDDPFLVPMFKPPIT